MRSIVMALVPLILLFSCGSRPDSAPFVDPVASQFDQTLKPFYHGVASGDPLPDRLIIWTRVTPEATTESIPVKWEVSVSEDFSTVMASDTTSARPERDFTVKVDVGGLQPGTTYYYKFNALGATSPVGRTKTTPVSSMDSIKFAVVSCANWEWGYFSAYEKIAERNDVDAVLHLGDYIYEYASGRYGDTTIRKNLPTHEIVTLEDYRSRHSLYRTDRGLRKVSQRHPMIAIWDDHEVANDAYTQGAQNHQPDQEGEYQKRKNIAKQVYYEWLPIRESDKLYRSYSYGPLADVVMLDERLEGRTKPADSITDPTFNNEERAMLGKEQLGWLKEKLSNSTASWKVIGNQVLYSDVDLSRVTPKRPRNLDAWDGYPAEKKDLSNFIATKHIKDILILAGDTHSSWAIEAAIDVPRTYNAKTSAGAFAVELGTTSISSANQDESAPADTVKKREALVLKTNPHVKYLNARDHGYMLLTLYPKRAKAQWYFMKNLRDPDTDEYLAKTFFVEKGSVRLLEK
jgi:alkaline phosphatase D